MILRSRSSNYLLTLFLPKNEVHLFCIYCSILPDTDLALRGTTCTLAVKDRSFFASLNYFCFRFSLKAVSLFVDVAQSKNGKVKCVELSPKFDPLWSELS